MRTTEIREKAMNIEGFCKKICEISQKYNESKYAYKSSSGEGIYVVEHLNALAKEITVKLNLTDSDGYSTVISKGKSNLPKVLWVAIAPKGRPPATSMSVAICFGRRGEGIVAGMMVPKTGAAHIINIVDRRSSELKVDIDGDKSNTKYNNCYVNPKEWLFDNIDDESLIGHLRSSLDQLALLSKDVQNYDAYYGR
jgi:hypothetical protein